MKRLFCIALAVALLGCGCAAPTDATPPAPTTTATTTTTTTTTTKKQSFVAGWKIAATADSILAVQATGTTALVTLHGKDKEGNWSQLLSTSGFVGTEGVGKASESRAATPEGTYSLTRAFGIAKNPGTALPYTQVDGSHYWVDDSQSAHYNRLVSTKTTKKDWQSAEHLIDYTTSYEYAVAIDYNTACVPGAGSAFFIHCSNGAPTYGCVSVPRQDMITILQHLTDHAYVVIQKK